MKNPIEALIKVDHYKPPRICFLGPGGVGKTTAATSAPKPIVIPTEDGLGEIAVPAFPKCESYDQFADYLDWVINAEHNYKSCVIDSADWLDSLIQKKVGEDHGKKTASEIEYGKGAGLVASEWMQLVKKMDWLRDRGMLVVFTAHSANQKINDPRYGAYDRISIKMAKESAAIFEEWLDVILFCEQEMHIKKDDLGFKKTKNRAIGTGDRIMYAVGSPAMCAKNRYGLPEIMPLGWKPFEAEFKASLKRKKQQADETQTETTGEPQDAIN